MRTMNRLTIFSILCLTAAGGAARAAELAAVSGKVEIERAGSTSWTKARPKSEIKEGDKLRTSHGAAAEIRMSQGHKLAVREKTNLLVESIRPDNISFKILVGRVLTFVHKLEAGTKFSVRSPIAVASVRGTVFDLQVDERGASRLSVVEGAVDYRDVQGLGAGVQVLKGQSVMMEPGAAPRPAEPLPADLQANASPAAASRAEASPGFDFKADVQREAGLAAFKDAFQTDAALEMKTAQYQEGKTAIDAFGNRVRLEEYIARPAANEFSFVALNTREDRFDFTRFDLTAHAALPEDLSTVNLFSQPGSAAMTNWAEKTHRLTSNGADYYREWQDGGTPVAMTDSNNNQAQVVVFSHWFVEQKAGSGDPLLLSHWVPDPAFLGGNPAATKARDDADLTANGVRSNPAGYDDFGSGAIGDARPLDGAGFTGAQRLDYFNNASVAAAYQGSEGYARSSVALFDDKTFASATLAEILSAHKLSQVNTYTVPGGSDISVRVDQYYVKDDGDQLSFLDAATLGANVEGVNYESVTTGSLMGGRKLDVVISPSIFRKAGLLNN